jgi:prepilin-type N-terminal cleavage/methylation domain-containing protein
VDGPEGNSLKHRGVSLLEVLTVIVVIGILLTLLLPVISTMRARAQRAQCLSNLRTLYVAAESFVQQNGSWPQISVSDDDSDTADQNNAKAWVAALKPFGPTEKSWICPTIQDLLHNPDYMQPENARVDYLPMPFDDKPMTPHQWPKQPWFAESGDVHGNGNLIIFTDGSVSDLKTIARQASPASAH